MTEKYISRKVACNLSFSHGLNEDGILYVPYYEVINYLQNISPADVRPVVRYKWQTLDTEFAGRAFVCPCNFISTEKTNFCPDCGADMREVE